MDHRPAVPLSPITSAAADGSLSVRLDQSSPIRADPADHLRLQDTLTSFLARFDERFAALESKIVQLSDNCAKLAEESAQLKVENAATVKKLEGLEKTIEKMMATSSVASGEDEVAVSGKSHPSPNRLRSGRLRIPLSISVSSGDAARGKCTVSSVSPKKSAVLSVSSGKPTVLSKKRKEAPGSCIVPCSL